VKFLSAERALEGGTAVGQGRFAVRDDHQLDRQVEQPRSQLGEGGIAQIDNGTIVPAYAEQMALFGTGGSGRDLAIDLGTANTLVYERGRGIALSDKKKLLDRYNSAMLAVSDKIVDTQSSYRDEVSEVWYVNSEGTSLYQLRPEVVLSGNQHFVLITGYTTEGGLQINDPWFADTVNFKDRYGDPSTGVVSIRTFTPANPAGPRGGGRVSWLANAIAALHLAR